MSRFHLTHATISTEGNGCLRPSKCYVAGVVKGDGAEERERWHVRLPMRTTGAGYPYMRDTGKNVRVLLINPSTGAAVVAPTV